MNFDQQYSMESAQTRTNFLSAFMRSVYNWMAIGLALTAIASFFTLGSSRLLYALYTNQLLFWGLVAVEVGMVFFLSSRIGKLSAGAATGLFAAYSLLNGVTLSVLVSMYTLTSITAAFVTTAGMFAAMSIYGHVTKRDLTSWGSFLFMGLIGIIIASIVNIFLKSSMMHFIISCVGVVVFVGLTAYDTQKLKQMGESAPMDDAVAVRRGVILGALTLYLDFINLFIMILRLIGDRR